MGCLLRRASPQSPQRLRFRRRGASTPPRLPDHSAGCKQREMRGPRLGPSHGLRSQSLSHKATAAFSAVRSGSRLTGVPLRRVEAALSLAAGWELATSTGVDVVRFGLSAYGLGCPPARVAGRRVARSRNDSSALPFFVNAADPTTASRWWKPAPAGTAGSRSRRSDPAGGLPAAALPDQVHAGVLPPAARVPSAGRRQARRPRPPSGAAGHPRGGTGPARAGGPRPTQLGGSRLGPPGGPSALPPMSGAADAETQRGGTDAADDRPSGPVVATACRLGRCLPVTPPRSHRQDDVVRGVRAVGQPTLRRRIKLVHLRARTHPAHQHHYFPKATDLRAHSRERLAAVAAELNTRPRKTLGWDTPAARASTPA